MSAANNTGRRDFLKYLGLGVASLNAAACIRKPAENILPFATRPDGFVPGEPRMYASSWAFGESVLGLTVRSTDGRPTKIEGNPNHPMSRGATNAWAQASVLELYSPERTRFAWKDGAASTDAGQEELLASLSKGLAASGGAGFALLVDALPSPTLERLVKELLAKYPKAKVYAHDGAGDDHARQGAALLGVSDVTFSQIGPAKVIAAIDADPLATEGDVVAFSRFYAEGRRVQTPAAKHGGHHGEKGAEEHHEAPEHKAAGEHAEKPHAEAQANAQSGGATGPGSMTRLYAVAPALTLTAANADHRLALKGSAIGGLLAAVSEQLRAGGLSLPALAAPADVKDLPFVKVLAEDLLANKGESLVVVGERQPAAVHALGLAINAALGNLGKTLRAVKRERPQAEGIAALAAAIKGKAVQQLVVLGGNPVHTAPGDLAFAELFSQVPQTVHLGLVRDETGARAKWHLPKSHYLEAWGDLVARDGTVSLQQPLIAPLYAGALSPVEVAGRLLGLKASGYDLVRETHKAAGGANFDKAFRRWLHTGVIAETKPVAATVTPATDKLAGALKTAPAAAGTEVAFVRDASILDGRFATSPWLQELPDPVTKICWDNAALLSPATFKKLGLEDGQLIKVGHHGQEVQLAAFSQQGTADDVVVLPLGYGRAGLGKYAQSGFAVESLRLLESPGILTGATLTATSGHYALASPQPEKSEHGRPLVRNTEITDFINEPNFVEKFDPVEKDELKSLWEEPNAKDGHQWGMTIDLSSCTSCNACTVACQAENNIPWVGKEQVAVGRVMHWIRIDRYLDEVKGHLAFEAQPMACSHCETAPCENVCPVGATSHSPEGLNDMAYNRCIGTRYCNNNCPYKVRRFNFFNFNLRNDEEYGVGIAMQRNQEVTVRFRGVMEKCTYCVQKINHARIDAKVNHGGVIADGVITPSCAGACPTQAITFGNINDPESRVAKAKADPRNYAVLSELNIRPRTTYLARIENPNPKLPRG